MMIFGTGLSIKNIPLHISKESLYKTIIEFCTNDKEIGQILAKKYFELKMKQNEDEAIKKHWIQRAAVKSLKKFTICMEKTEEQFGKNESNKILINSERVLDATDLNNKSVSFGGMEGRSKGFGFVTFDDHEIALRVLKYLNNNENVFRDSQQRPIVDFTVEDKRALRHHEKLLAKLKTGNAKATIGTERASKKRKAYSRGE